MSASRQLAFDLGGRSALGRDDFLVASCNAEAVAWIDRWPDWPATTLVIHGPAGAGKTHLAHVWQARSGAEMASGGTDDLIKRATVNDGLCAIVDDADRAVVERALLHLCNAIGESSGHLLLTATTPPARWQIGLPDLRSRLSAMPSVGIGVPDDQLLAAVLVKLFSDRQVRVGADVIAYVVARIERSFDAARRMADALDMAAIAARTAVTIPLARQVLQEQKNSQ